MTLRYFFSTILIIASLAGLAADPTATNYGAVQCQGSLRPYPAPDKWVCPDSLTPVFIDHVGRHGSRYPAGSGHTMTLLRALDRADSLGTITKSGRRLRELVSRVARESAGQWGALDSLGMAEQRGIASRMVQRFPSLFKGGRVDALSSYSPRCIMSMYSFTHQLARLDNSVEIYTNSGRQNSLLMRPFDVEADYVDFRNSDAWAVPYDAYAKSMIPVTALHRVLGDGFPYSDVDEQDLALIEYYVTAGMNAMSVPCDLGEFFTKAEMNALWSCFNLRQYLQRTATTVSAVPAEIAAPLLQNLLTTLEEAADGLRQPAVRLRFGHAETLMPLLSLMHLQGCYYMTNYFDTVGLHWCDFDVVPMAANLQLVLFKSAKGAYYLGVFHNERLVPLQPGSDTLYTPWTAARTYLEHCIPMYYRL